MEHSQSAFVAQSVFKFTSTFRSCHRYDTPTCRYRRDLSWNAPPPGQKVSPILTFPEEAFYNNPSITIKDNDLARVLLLGDGHLPQLLGSLPTIRHTRNDRLFMNHIHSSLPSKSSSFPPSPPSTPSHCVFPSTPVKRTVTFHENSGLPGVKRKHLHKKAVPCLSPKSTLLYCTSTWCPQSFYDIMMSPEDYRHLPAWHVFQEQRIGLSRLVTAVHYGTCPAVVRSFGFPPDTPVWARDLIFYRRQLPFLCVHEILSPQLEKYVGSMQPTQLIED